MKVEPLATNPKFIPTIARWYVEEWGDTEYVQSKEKEINKLKAYLNERGVPIVLTAIMDEEVVGVVQLKEYEMEIYPNFQYWLGGVYVSKIYRGKGIAKSLVMSAIQKAKELGISKLFLQTEYLSGGMYAELGWSKIEEVYYSKVDVAVMELALNRID